MPRLFMNVTPHKDTHWWNGVRFFFYIYLILYGGKKQRKLSMEMLTLVAARAPTSGHLHFSAGQNTPTAHIKNKAALKQNIPRNGSQTNALFPCLPFLLSSR